VQLVPALFNYLHFNCFDRGSSNCLLQQVITGNIKEGIEMTGRGGRRRRKLLDDLKERRGYSHLNEKTLDFTVWRARFGRGFRPAVRQTAK
jgi:hypothetical protein